VTENPEEVPPTSDNPSTNTDSSTETPTEESGSPTETSTDQGGSEQTPEEPSVPADPIDATEEQESQQQSQETTQENQSTESSSNSTPTEQAVNTLLEQSNGQPVSAEAIKEAGLTYADLPPATPVEVRTDEDGNAVIITAEVAAALVLLENPTELLGAIFSDPGQALTALTNIGADMSPAEREESTKIIVASVIAGQAAVNAATMAAAATTGSTGGSSGGGGGGGASGDGKKRNAVRRRKLK